MFVGSTDTRTYTHPHTHKHSLSLFLSFYLSLIYSLLHSITPKQSVEGFGWEGGGRDENLDLIYRSVEWTFQSRIDSCWSVVSLLGLHTLCHGHAVALHCLAWRMSHLTQWYWIQLSVCVLLCFVDQILGNLTVRGHSLSQGTWGCRILTLHLNYLAGYTGPLLFRRRLDLFSCVKLTQSLIFPSLCFPAKKMAENLYHKTVCGKNTFCADTTFSKATRLFLTK